MPHQSMTFPSCRSLSDIGHSTAANDAQASASFSAHEKSSPYSSEYASGFSEPAALHLPAPRSPRDERNVGQAPSICTFVTVLSLLFPISTPAQDKASQGSRDRTDFQETHNLNRGIQGFKNPLNLWGGDNRVSLFDSPMEEAGDFREATLTWPPLIPLDPVHIPAHYKLSAVVSYNHGVARLHHKDINGAIHEWQTALYVQPDMAEALLGLGSANILRGEISAAKDHFSLAVSLRSDWPEAWNGLGFASHLMGRDDEAREAWEHAVSLRPDYAEALLNLGRAHSAEGNLGHALTAFRAALNARPDLAEAYHHSGLLLSKLGRWNEAIPLFGEALRLDPTMDSAAFALGKAQAAVGDLPGALHTWRAISGHSLPADSLAYIHFMSGQLLWQLGQAKQALEEFQHAVSYKPDFEQAYFQTGSVLLALRQWGKAGEAFRQTVAIEPFGASAYVALGTALYQQQDLLGALTAYREAIRLAPAFAEGQFLLGVTLVTLNRPEEAIFHIQRAAEAGLTEAEDLLGSFYFTGNGVQPSIAEAMKWWGRAARHEPAGSASSHAQEQLSRLRRRIFRPHENGTVLQPIREGFAAIQEDLRATSVLTLPTNTPDQTAGMILIMSNRVEDGLRFLLNEGYALHPHAFLDLMRLFEEGIPNRLAQHDPRILRYLVDTAKEGSPSTCKFLNRLSRTELATVRHVLFDPEITNQCPS